MNDDTHEMKEPRGSKRRRSRGGLAGVVLATVATVLLTVGSAGAQSKCTSAKFKAAGKKIGAKSKCHSKAVSKGLAVDSACLQKAEDKYTSGWTKAEGSLAAGGAADRTVRLW